MRADMITQALFPANYFREKMGMGDRTNPFELELMETLRTLDAIDKRLPHTPEAVWPEPVTRQRNYLVWHAFDIARELDMAVGVYPDYTIPDMVVVAIMLPLSEGYSQVSWHVPSVLQWDGHNREEKTRRIAEYTKDLP